MQNSSFSSSNFNLENGYPFGMVMPGRSFTSESYRFGFNGKEKDSEGMGGGGSTYDYGFRIYNPQLAKFLSVDPLTASYPWYTPYQFAGNMPISAIDLDGLEERQMIIDHYESDGSVVITLRTDRDLEKLAPGDVKVIHRYYNVDGKLVYVQKSTQKFDRDLTTGNVSRLKTTIQQEKIKEEDMIEGGNSLDGSNFKKTFEELKKYINGLWSKGQETPWGDDGIPYPQIEPEDDKEQENVEVSDPVDNSLDQNSRDVLPTPEVEKKDSFWYINKNGTAGTEYGYGDTTTLIYKDEDGNYKKEEYKVGEKPVQ